MRTLLLLLWGILTLPLLHAQTSNLLDIATAGAAEQIKSAIAGGADVNARDDVGKQSLCSLRHPIRMRELYHFWWRLEPRLMPAVPTAGRP